METGALLRFAQGRLQIAAMAFMVFACGLRIVWLLKFPAGKSNRALSPAVRSASWRGGLQSLFQTAMPWTMASLRQHPAHYFEFVVLHLGIAASIAMSLLIPYAPDVMADTSVAVTFQITFAAALAAGLMRLYRRATDPYLKKISTPDDYFSLGLLLAWLAMATVTSRQAAGTGQAPRLAYFFLTAILFLLVPFSKILHYIYYPLARWHLGSKLAPRGAYPMPHTPGPSSGAQMPPVTKSHKAESVVRRMRQCIDRQAVVSLQACAHCGLCTDQCHYVLANPGDPTYAPAYKADRLRRLFKGHLGWTGRLLPWWVGARRLYSDNALEDLKDVVFGKCTNCQRCSVNCPMGVDMAGLNRFARGLLTHVGIMPEGFAAPAQNQWEIGNQLGVLPEEYLQTLQWIEEELRREYDDRTIRVPIDRIGATVVYGINPREIRYDPRSFAEAAAIFHYAGANWTMTSQGWDVTNFGLFNGDTDLSAAMTARMSDAVQRVGASKLIVSEWGYGLRSVHSRQPEGNGGATGFQIENSVVTMLRYITEGRIRVDPSRNRKPVTYHDPCTAARGYGMVEEPRRLLKLICADFREMYPNGAQNFCCTGGGGALFMSEYSGERLKSAKIKADQLRATGAKVVATSCHNCLDSLAEVIRHYELDMEVALLVNLVAQAMIVPAREGARPLAFCRVLVISGNADQRRQLAGILRLHGCQVIETPDTEAGLSAAHSAWPELIVLDLDMPGEVGAQLYYILKSDRRLAGIPVITVTDRADIDHPFGVHVKKPAGETRIPRPEGFVNRPLDPEVLTLTVRRLLLKSQTTRENQCCH